MAGVDDVVGVGGGVVGVAAACRYRGVGFSSLHHHTPQTSFSSNTCDLN